MKFSNLAPYTVGVIAVGAIVAACSGHGSSPTSTLPGGTGTSLVNHDIVLSAVGKRFLTTRHLGFHGRRAPASERLGLYTNQFLLTSANVLGYSKNNRSNGPPTCSESTGARVNDIAVDSEGNLIVPNNGSGIQVYSGPSLCGTLLMTIPDSIGQAADAAAQNAVTGPIVVGHANGTVATCNPSGCTQLTSPNMCMSCYSQVAMDKSGNCYATSLDQNTGKAALWYYAGCSGTGTELGSAQGFNEGIAEGGLDVDNKGNLVVLAQGGPSYLTVYSGCGTGTCTLVTGPTALSGAGGGNDCVYGHLGRKNERYACGDYTLGQIDIYSYLPSRTPSYLYSFNNGMVQSNITEAASYAPSSKGD
ncbi:MAG: hypothetical protein JO190_01070 [Candidatus Eremiobacteraeota bacterium]|nr:hypothetical protein [Candidatus Eremiobacteraeota bacterium]MBV8498731.1 hypothetical protein [Candidatus Eremiobacteraeota bacterium]